MVRFCLLSGLFLLSVATNTAAQSTFWVGPSGSVWSDPLNWAPFLPFPGPGVFVSVDNSDPLNHQAIVDTNFTIGSLQVTGGDRVDVASGVTLTLDGPSANVQGIGFVLLQPNATLSGASSYSSIYDVPIQMQADSRIITAGTFEIFRAFIYGEGTIGDGGGAETVGSLCTISANVPGRTLRINAPPVAFINSGTLNATIGGKLELLGKFTNGSLGYMQATFGTISLLNASTISGGTFTSAGLGRIAIGDSGAAIVALKDVTNDGTMELSNSSVAAIDSSMLNQGTILMSNVGAATPTINGNGFRLTNSLNGTIKGRGRIGVNELAVTNSGTIEASGAGANLVIDPPDTLLAAFLNNGTLSASGGGTLRLTGAGGGTFTNSPQSVLSAAAGSTIELISGAFIQQGRIENGGGVVRLPSTTGIATLKDVTNEGTISTGATTGLTIEGSLTNSGWLNIGTSSAGVASLTSGGLLGATLSGGGTVTLLNEATSRITGTVRLTNVDNLIQGAGKIGMDTMPMTNSGTIDANIAGKVLEIDPPLLIDGFQNNGYVRASNGGVVRLIGTDGFFLSSGTYNVQSGSALESTPGAIIGVSWLSNDGTVNLNSASSTFTTISGTGTLTVNGGTLSNTTMVEGRLINDGVIRITSAGTISGAVSGTGTLEISHATFQAQSIRQSALVINSPGGVSLVEIPTAPNSTIGTSKVQSLSSIPFGDRLELNNNAFIVEDANAFNLQFDIRELILTGRIASQLPSSTLAEDAVGIAVKSGSFRGQSISGDAVCIAVTLRGDGDLNGTVDSIDFGYFTAGFGMSGYTTQWMYGDYNYDFRIDTSDFNYLAGNFGLSMPAPTLGASSLGTLIPEPLCIAGLFCLLPLGNGRLRHRIASAESAISPAPALPCPRRLTPSPPR